jgi:flagellar biosynthetic protein FliQ
MTDAQVIEIISGAFEVAAKVGGPILMTALFVGVTVSLLQTITQIQEMTLTFVPKLVAMGLVVLVSGRWMIRTVVTWVEGLWSLIPSI